MKFIYKYYLYYLALLSVLIIISTSGCVEEEKNQQEKAIYSCIEMCKNFNKDLSKGPCLSENITLDWVCDAAHNPREDIDNNPENQCSAYREGKAHHFVEVDTKCNLIKSL